MSRLVFLFFSFIMKGNCGKGGAPVERRLTSYTGCMLLFAAGDGLGFGPEPVNGYLPTTAYTQMAAYAANGLLVGLTRGQLSGAMAPPVRYVAMALKEWAGLQLWRQEAPACWISRSPRLDYRRCPEPELLDVLAAGTLGTMEEHHSRLSGPGALMAAVSVGLFFDPVRLPRREIQRLGAEAAALTHGDPAAFLSGAALAHIISRIAWDGERDLDRLVREAGAMLLRRFGREYHQVWGLRRILKRVRTLARSETVDRETALAELGREKAYQILAGALYCCLTDRDDPQRAVTAAAGWSGPGAAVAGAILGAVCGEEALPESWLEQLECAEVLRELAQDLFRGCPMMKGNRVFDVEWDAKYDSEAL